MHGHNEIDVIDVILDEGRRQGRKQGFGQGRDQGIEPLVHQFTRRLQRPLAARERATLVRRLGTLGPERLGDVVLDLDPTALAAWLANPKAR